MGGEANPGQICDVRRCVPSIEEQLEHAIALESEALIQLDLDEFERALRALRRGLTALSRLKGAIHRYCADTLERDELLADLRKARGSEHEARRILRGTLPDGSVSAVEIVKIKELIRKAMDHKLAMEDRLPTVPGCGSSTASTTTMP